MHKSQNTMANGILSPDTVDLLSVAKDGTVDLVIVETNRWIGSQEEAALLKNKIHYYCCFFRDGQFAKTHPDLVGRPARIRLFIRHPLSDAILNRVDDIRSELLKLGLGWDIKQLENEDANKLGATNVGVEPKGSLWKRMLNWFLCRRG